MFNSIKISLFFLLICFCPLAQAISPLTTTFPPWPTTNPSYIGADIPADPTHPTELKAEYNTRFVSFSQISLDGSEVNYTIDLYFGYITVRTTDGTRAVKNFVEYYTDTDRSCRDTKGGKETCWDKSLKQVSNGLSDFLSRLPSHSDDYKIVSLVKNSVDTVTHPVDNGINLPYGNTAGWKMDSSDIQFYYGNGGTIAGFTNYDDGFSGGYSSSATSFYGKFRKIQLDMSKAEIRFYYNDYTVNALTAFFPFDFLAPPQKTISFRDLGWRQALLEVRLIERNGGLDAGGLADSDKSQIASQIEQFINSRLPAR